MIVGVMQDALVQRPRATRHIGGAAHLLGQLPGNALDFRVAVAVGLCDSFQQTGEAWHIVAVNGREVCAAIEWLAVWGEEHGHGPAAAAGQHLHRFHVDGVQIRPLLAVDFNVDEVIVHDLGNGVVLKGLALHHVTPVAGRIADAQQDGFVLAPRTVQRLRAPRIPVHGIVGVLQQIGAGLVNQAVGHERHFLSGVGRMFAGFRCSL